MSQGELDNWRTVPFQMYVGGPIWYPPTLSSQVEKKGIKESRPIREELSETLISLSTKRQSIREAMGFCMDHADKSSEVRKFFPSDVF